MYKELEEYIKKGFSVVPIPVGGKNPRLPDWNKKRFGSKDFQEPSNIGVLLGEPSGWLTDVDLDSIEAIRIAPLFLSETTIFGHGSGEKARSHYLYYCEGSKTTRFQFRGETIVEIRSTGCQTVFPPSIHPSGEQYQFYSNSHVETVDFQDLLENVSKIAGLSLLAKYWARRGSRQDCALAFAGALLRRDVLEEDVEHYLRAIAVATEDEETKSRIQTVIYTTKKLEENKPATGLNRLLEYIPEEVVKQAFKWLKIPFEKKQSRHHLVVVDKFYPRPFSQEIMSQYSFWFVGGNGDFYWFDSEEGIWREDAEDFIRNYFRKSTETIQDVQKKIHVLSEIVADVRDLSWKGRPIPESPKVLIPFKNGVFDLETDEFRDFQEDDYFTWKLPYNYNGTANCSYLYDLIVSFLNQEDTVSLWELLGYCLWRGYEYQKIFFLFGRGSNGKSTFARVLERMLGRENVAHISLKELQENRFAGAYLYHKLANISGELEYAELKNTRLIKQLCGEDTITVERKYKNPFSYLNYAKLIFLTNEIPKSRDTTEAFYRRLFLIEFPKKFTSDPGFMYKIDNLPEEEYEGLLILALDQLRKLIRQGLVFTQDKGEDDIKKEYLKLSSPLNQFVEENCILTYSREDFIYKYEFGERFQRWLADKGRTSYDDKRIAGEMRDLGLEESRRGEGNWRCWIGIRWKD
ncbi:MAG: phage/plasmid primase, P4 family [bacterium]|nr:phage/plasmid primase, P4 family [bacterium]